MSELLPSLVIDFDPAIEWNGATVNAMELREPKAGEVLKAQAELKGQPDSSVRYGIALVGVVSGKPRQVVEQMPISKLMEAINYLMDFLNAGPVTGENS